MARRQWPVYTGSDLGASYQQESTTFRLWSPNAESVSLLLFESGHEGAAYAKSPMKKEKQGVWGLTVEGDLSGVYYQYLILVEGQPRETGDPYAKACGVNGVRSMVVDLKTTNPPGWEADKAPHRPKEDVIYEVHVKEFSYDKSGGFSEENRGKYKAFTEKGTTLHGGGIHPTGLAHIKALGVTHIQLMPIYDFGSVDEAGDPDAFNWGYDPVNYNVPEGSYASDPYHGQVRIRELKEAIGALHSAGFRVIMDVVYNHTHAPDSTLGRTAPGYFYRTKRDGTLRNGSSCGNDIASERPMCSKYILESVLYWCQEYHIDGFRFDLMGLLDVALMNQIRSALDERYGAGEKLVFGEPWAAGPSPMEKGSIPALRSQIDKLHSGVGVFCDSTRDAVKGHVFQHKAAGFVNGGKNLETSILHAASAWCKEGAPHPAKAPSQIITYISAHDNMTLWDKLVVSMMENPDYLLGDARVLRANRLAAAIYLTCQGRLFLLSGEEFARTKEGAENSYCDPIAINRLDWQRADQNRDLCDYYRGLIALRREIPGLCEKGDNAKAAIRRETIEGPGCVSFVVENAVLEADCTWGQLFLVYNAAEQAKDISLPEGDWALLADEISSSYWQGATSCRVDTGKITVPPVSARIWGKRDRV